MTYAHTYITGAGKISTKGKKVAKSKTDIFYNVPFWTDFQGVSPDALVKGEVGLEIECEGSSLFDTPIRWWTAHEDHSLRAYQGHPPIEYVLKSPIDRTDVPKALSYLAKQLKSSQSVVIDSTRTSVHVHVNVQDKTLKEIFTFICLYLLFENALVEFSGPQRVGNLFCLRAKDASAWVWDICNAFESKDFSRVFNAELRYTACNTASLSKFGSLEFRSMRGTVDQQTIELWINMLLHLKDYALDNYKNPAEVFDAYVAVGGIALLQQVFAGQPAMLSVLVGTSNLERGIVDGAEFVKDIAQSVETWQEKKSPEEIRSEQEVVSAKAEDEPMDDLGPNGLDARLADAKDGSRWFTNPNSFSKSKTFMCIDGPKTIALPPESKVWYDDLGPIAITELNGEFREWYPQSNNN